MSEEELRKGVIRTIIIIVILIVLIMGLGIYIFYNRNTPTSVFTSTEAKEEYEKSSNIIENEIEEITDQNVVNEILSTNLEASE